MIAPVARTNLRDQAFSAVRRAITSGELAPGQHLSEVELADKLGVSRATLREAIRRLEQEGLIIADRRMRMRVRVISSAEVLELYEVRGAIESLAARQIARSTTKDAAVTDLRLRLRTLRESTSTDEQAEADLALHRRLCELSGNLTLVKMWDTLEGGIRLSMTRAGVGHALQNMGADRHALLIDAIESGDAAQIDVELTEHMRNAAARLVDDTVDAPGTPPRR